MTELPVLGEKSRTRPIALLSALSLLGAGMGGGLYVKMSRAEAQARQRAEAQAAAQAAAAKAAAAELEADPLGGMGSGKAASAGGTSPLERAGLKKVSITMNGPLERSVVAAVGRTVGLPLTQVMVRSLVWWVNVPGDFRKGDVVDVLYEERAGEEPLVYAVRFKSGRLSRTMRAYRFQPAGSRFARFYHPDESELELRLEHSPIDDYEQITSLLRDGRGHKGVDFKAPTGTPVKATFDGVITRRTWSFKMNGNSLELHEEGGAGRTALYLHLSEIPAGEAKVGTRFRRGEVMARSGNTGHSFAPHLHYQLSTPAAPVADPFAIEPTVRRALPAADREAFAAEVKRLDALLDSDPAGK